MSVQQLIWPFSLALVVCACGASRPTHTHQSCSAPLEVPHEAVAWRRLGLAGCGDIFITEGGSDPHLPSLPFPIHDEAVIREGFGCLEPGAEIGVDFETERVERVDYGIGHGSIAWIVQTDTALVGRHVTSHYCGGITPELTAILLVVPRDAPPLTMSGCMAGAGCTGPARP